MTDRLTKFNEETGEYEYRERAKTQEEYNEQRKAVIQKLGRLEDNEEMFMTFIPKERADEQR